MLEIFSTIAFLETMLLIALVWNYFTKRRQSKDELTEPSKQDDYAIYMKLKDDEASRAVALRRAKYKCELCDADYDAIYEVRYPQRYKDSHLDNLLVVCERCHAKLYGVRAKSPSQQLANLFLTEVSTGTKTYLFELDTNPKGIQFLKITENNKSRRLETDEDYLIIIEFFLQDFMRRISEVASFVSIQAEEKRKNTRLISKTLSADDRTYFFEVKRAINGNRYLTIIENKRRGKNELERRRIMIFEDGFDSFVDGLERALQHFVL